VFLAWRSRAVATEWPDTPKAARGWRHVFDLACSLPHIRRLSPCWTLSSIHPASKAFLSAPHPSEFHAASPRHLLPLPRTPPSRANPQHVGALRRSSGEGPAPGCSAVGQCAAAPGRLFGSGTPSSTSPPDGGHAHGRARCRHRRSRLDRGAYPQKRCGHRMEALRVALGAFRSCTLH
jgi:hypothetical protein